jgi:CRP/FNR family transcriptional regulator
MNTLRKTIVQSPLFGGLSKRQLDPIERIAREVRFARGATIFAEGDPGDGFYIVVSGRIKVFKVSGDGKEQILHIYGPGQPVGEVPVFAGQSFPAHAQALENSHLLFFARKAFLDLIAAHPSLAMNMLALLSQRLRQFALQVENLSLKALPGRLASYLLHLSCEHGGARQVALPIPKHQLASLLGTIPETLSRIFARLSAQNIIAIRGRRITLSNVPALEDLAAGEGAAD